jgi:methyl-accepting chemotaxis protein
MLADAEQAAKVRSPRRSRSPQIVAAARAGDFSGQAEAGDVDGPLQLVDGINQINAVVDARPPSSPTSWQCSLAGAT